MEKVEGVSGAEGEQVGGGGRVGQGEPVPVTTGLGLLNIDSESL